MNRVRSARSALEGAARSFDAPTCSGTEAVALLEELGAVRRLVDGLVARVAKRAEDTAAHTYGTDRSAPELCERLVGISAGEAKRAIAVASGLYALPATDAAVREGRLSARQADLIVTAATEDPTAERELLAAASVSRMALRDACVAVRARREDETARAERQHAARSFRTWTASDGMVEGHFKVTPEIGGAIRARIDDGTRRGFHEARKHGTREQGRLRGRRVRRRHARWAVHEDLRRVHDPCGDRPRSTGPGRGPAR